MRWYNIREHKEPSGCEADIWRVCANHDEAKQNHDIMSTAHENRSAMALCVHHQSFGLVIT